MVLNESKIVEMVSESLEKVDLKKYIKDDKDFEKRVKQIVADVVTDLFRVLWQHNGIFKNLSK